MIDRESLGVVASTWPTFSIPDSVKPFADILIGRLPPEVQAREIGKGYHNAGWGYTEIEIQAPTWSRAYDEAERISMEVMIEFQMSA